MRIGMLRRRNGVSQSSSDAADNERHAAAAPCERRRTAAAGLRDRRAAEDRTCHCLADEGQAAARLRLIEYLILEQRRSFRLHSWLGGELRHRCDPAFQLRWCRAK